MAKYFTSNQMNESKPTTIKPQVSKTHYDEQAFSPLRIESITQQVREICYSGCTQILEIGVGKGLLKHFLSPFPKINLVNVDIDENLKPDFIASVTQMPFCDKKFELTVCGRVLEHLPFNDFPIAIREIHRVTEKKVILSLPDIRKHAGLAIRIPGIDNWKKWELNLDQNHLGVTSLPLCGFAPLRLYYLPVRVQFTTV